MASILPNQIPPPTSKVLDGLIFEKNWWLFFYNISLQVLGNQGTSAAAYAAQLVADLDADADESDLLPLVRRVNSLEKLVGDPDPSASIADVIKSLVLAQDGLLPDVIPRPQPVQVLTLGASPWTYTAPFDGTVVVTGGTVSLLSWSRDGGVTFYTVSGAIPVSRLDQVKVTYSAAPIAQFFPR